jgi:hypothetical protein
MAVNPTGRAAPIFSNNPFGASGFVSAGASLDMMISPVAERGDSLQIRGRAVRRSAGTSFFLHMVGGGELPVN